MGITEIPSKAATAYGNIVSDPKLMPKAAALSSDINIHYGTTAAGPGAATFWTGVGNFGAFVTGCSSDTWKTVCDLTGAGDLFSVGGPAGSSAMTQFDIRVTVDYTVTTVTLSYGTSGRRMVLGALFNGYVQTDTAGTTATSSVNVPILGGFTADCYNTTYFEMGQHTYLPTPFEVMSFGFPRLRFEKNLKVEVRADIVGTGTYEDRAWATYYLDD